MLDHVGRRMSYSNYKDLIRSHAVLVDLKQSRVHLGEWEKMKESFYDEPSKPEKKSKPKGKLVARLNGKLVEITNEGTREIEE